MDFVHSARLVVQGNQRKRRATSLFLGIPGLVGIYHFWRTTPHILKLGLMNLGSTLLPFKQKGTGTPPKRKQQEAQVPSHPTPPPPHPTPPPLHPPKQKLDARRDARVQARLQALLRLLHGVRRAPRLPHEAEELRRGLARRRGRGAPPNRRGRLRAAERRGDGETGGGRGGVGLGWSEEAPSGRVHRKTIKLCSKM